ncbi:PREDICTED: uncharacterized protein LOC104802059 [Tarenaya hassleriana]|uniref:uncharacterized protein LOC104802059 n=1 Tax=Tarenaya hassleriana TaxID=28532 RepID=UPI00053C68CF|nr:PREDICTED: uncharacterized protein LOC104802059 [Tarenaya hassleriana]
MNEWPIIGRDMKMPLIWERELHLSLCFGRQMKRGREMDADDMAETPSGMGREEGESFMAEVNLVVVLLSQLYGSDEAQETVKEQHEREEINEARARAQKRMTKETKLMERRTHVLHSMTKEFRHHRKM